MKLNDLYNLKNLFFFEAIFQPCVIESDIVVSV